MNPSVVGEHRDPKTQRPIEYAGLRVGPFRVSSILQPSSASLARRDTSPGPKSEHRWGTGNGSQEASVGLVPNLGSSSGRGQRTFRKAYPTRGLGCPATRQASPRTPQCQVTVPPRVPTHPEHTGCGAMGRATLGTGDSGFSPDASRERWRLGGARPAEALPALVDSSGPARPDSGSRSSAAAGSAHRNTAGTPGQRSSRRYRPRPGNCRHAPDDRLCHAPNQGYPTAYWIARPPLYLLGSLIAPGWQPIGRWGCSSGWRRRVLADISSTIGYF